MQAKRLCALALCLLMPPLLTAQAVYRCGARGASTAYSDRPCPGAKGRTVDVADPRDADQWAEAADVAQRAADTGGQLAKERQRNEALRKKASAIHGGGTRPDEPAPSQADRKPRVLRAAKAPCPKGPKRATRASENPRGCPIRRLPLG